MIQQFRKAVRKTFSKDRLLVCINIAGLAVALAASLIIVFYVQHETSYDRHWPDADRVYRLHNNFDLPGRAPYRLATTSSLLVPALQEAFGDEIEVGARARSLDVTYRVGEETFKDLVVAADPAFNALFPLDVMSGSMQSALGDTAGMALSEQLALLLFGTADVLGRTVTVEYPTSTADHRVNAVYALPEGASVLELPALVRFDENREPSLQGSSLGTWYQAPVASYVKLATGVNPDAIRARLDSISDNNIDVTPMSPGPDTKPSDRLFFDMSNIGDLHLDPEFQNVTGAGNRVTVQTFAVVAALILLIACINFAYLLLAKSQKRTAEVGIRKVLGASKRALLLQYLGESFLLVGLALMLGLALVELILPFLVNVLAIPLRVDYASAGTYLNIFGMYLLVALLGGLYPALTLSRFRPAAVLKSRTAPHTDALVTFKNMLLVFQFGVAIALIIATSVIYLQVEFVGRRDPGFRQGGLIVIHDLFDRQDVNANKQVLKERIAALPGVTGASLSGYHPMSTTTRARISSAHRLESRPDESFIMANAFIDEDFFPTYDIAVVAGRNFDRERDQVPSAGAAAAEAGSPAPRSVLINEAAARFLGFADASAALGAMFRGQPGFDGASVPYSIIGVVADNQFYSLKAQTRPEIYFLNQPVTDVLTIAYAGNPGQLMENLEAAWRDVMGDAVFTASFIEPLLASEFAQERRESQMFVVFSLFAIFIACLGLYGASAFSVERRTREIGIRKIMGAEIREIVALLLWQFSKPVLLANLIAWPVALWAMLTWLRQFPYQIDTMLLVPLCVLAGAVALSIAWVTVGGTAAKAASAKPVLALRYE